MKNELMDLEHTVKAGQFNLALSKVVKMKNAFAKIDYFWYLASAVYEANNLEMAIQSMDKAIEINKADLNYYYRRANLLKKSHNYSEAILDFKLIDSKISANLDVKVNLATCFLNLKVFDLALNYYTEVRFLQKGNEYFYEVGIASVFIEQKKFNEAQDIYAKLIRKFPSDNLLLLNFANLKAKLHLHEDVIVLLKSKVTSASYPVIFRYFSSLLLVDMNGFAEQYELLRQNIKETFEFLKLKQNYCDKSGINFNSLTNFKTLPLYNSILGLTLCKQGEVANGVKLLIEQFNNKNYVYYNESIFYCMASSLHTELSEILNFAINIENYTMPEPLAYEMRILNAKQNCLSKFNAVMKGLSCENLITKKNLEISADKVLHQNSERFTKELNELLYVEDLSFGDFNFRNIKQFIHSLHDKEEFYSQDQTVRNGTQTEGTLFTYQSENVLELKNVIDGAVSNYLDKKAHTKFIKEFFESKEFEYSSSFSIRLKESGHHVDHYHSNGIVSGVLYLDIDSTSLGQGSGWLRLGQLGLPYMDDFAEYYIKPKEGQIVLFPSHFWHGVNEFKSSSNRLAVVFDVIAN
ncbi:putative 2OG-Fe(II) oxygenase [Shewanella sp. 5_MG-2023]|uniref:2OG-Fe(II) oxygenase family protein n=1 Tax=Shewanella sp. 5_MG-2023 TaxID=3062656 RepID=UPI0026E2A620|nr:putative 2OG-Fe(II) oxygenase [Shewanella sp. 5_MG-2023]MDO6639317.1 putative 2OG-Fe(II) oxygenase [Shewanella sp. 5_MG-2023]